MVIIADAGFEVPDAQVVGGYVLNPTGTAWTYTGDCGILTTVPHGGDPSYSPTTTVEGLQVGYLHQAASIAQDIDFGSGGSFTLAGWSAGPLPAATSLVTVSLGGVDIGTYLNYGGATWVAWSIGPFTAAAGVSTLTLTATSISGSGGQLIVWLDALTLTSAASPPPPPRKMGGVIPSKIKYVYNPWGPSRRIEQDEPKYNPWGPGKPG